MKYVGSMLAVAVGLFSAMASAGRGAEMYGAEFTDQELAEWHARIAVRYGAAGDRLIEFRKACAIRGHVLAMLDERTILVQPAGGEPLALTVCSNAAGIKTGQAIDLRGIPAGKRNYPTATGSQRTAAHYDEVVRLAYERFIEIQQREPDHVAFAMMRSVARSRLMTAEEAARVKAAAEQRIQQLNDPRWQKKFISHNSGGSPVQPLTDAKQPIADVGQ